MFEIKDDNRLLIINFDPLPAMKWVFMTEKLIGILANCDEELATLLRVLTGIETAEVSSKDMELTARILKGLLKAISSLTDKEKEEIYNRILEGHKYVTGTGDGVVYLNCSFINDFIKNPSNFYIIIFECLKDHYLDFFQETIAKLPAVGKEKKEII